VARGRYGHLVAYAFLILLIGPIGEIVGGRTWSSWLSAAVLTTFVTCFVLVVELGRHPGAVKTPGPLATLPRSRRWLVAALSFVLLALAIAASLLFGRGFLVLFLYVAPAVVFSLPVRYAAVALFAVAGAVAATELVRGWSATSAATIASWTLSIALTGFVSLLLRRRMMLIDELRAAQGEIARLAAADAVIEERLRFARDLHDLLGHSLSVIVLKAELARRLLDRGDDRDRVQAEIADLEQIARRALDEVREAVTGYRARSLAAELQHAHAALEAAGVAVHTRVTAPALPPDIDDLLAWVVREASTNIVRHSRARRADIELTVVDGSARLEIRNDGVVPGAAPPGSGLVGLRERVALAGGQLTPASDAAGGFCVSAVVPLGVAP
jgi:two-component system sensor histidine kinase DesK